MAARGGVTSLVDKASALAAIAVQGWGLTGDRAVRGPLYAQISVCDACDHRCVMCPYHPPEPPSKARRFEAFGGEAPGVMSVDVFRAVVDELHALGTRRLDLVGRGEPLLHPNLVELVTYAKARGMAVAITTNGSRLDGERARALVAQRVDWLRVSLNAGRAETYPRIHVTESAASYESTCARVAALTAERRRAGSEEPHVTLSFTVSALNADEIVEMVEAVAQTGADAAHFQHVIASGGAADRALALADDAYARLLDRGIPDAEERARTLGVRTNLASFAATPPPDRGAAQGPNPSVVPCYVGSYFAVVLGNGSVMPCCQSSRPLGSVHEEGFSAIWKGERYRAFRRAARALPVASPALSSCECDRCYFRPHNLSVHRALHPLSALRARARAGGDGTEGLIRVGQLLRMSRLDRP
jgi:MoaA/NifB/PqqE/SkfB family radical SAM enzyme